MQEVTTSSNVTVYVSTLDQWSAVWPGFCHGLRKYWPDCPWPVAFSTEELNAPCGRSLKVGSEEHWTRRNRKALEKLATPVVLFMIDDFWLCDPVDTETLLSFAEVVEQGQADYIALAYGRREESDGDFDEKLYYRGKDEFYRLALQAALWRREVLIELLTDDIMTPWAFEQSGRARSQDLTCLATKEFRFLKYVERSVPEWIGGAVIRGKWQPSAMKYALREELTFDFSVNPDGSRND